MGRLVLAQLAAQLASRRLSHLALGACIGLSVAAAQQQGQSSPAVAVPAFSLELGGRDVLITGASQGIGAAIAHRCTL
jgi:hypothetical protein